MTREEAWDRIDTIIAKHEVDDAYVTIINYKDFDALRLARKLLEQEPCEDAISRQAVLDLISKFILEIHTEGGRDLNSHTNDVLRQILRNVGSDRVLPSVNPQQRVGHWIQTEEKDDAEPCILWECSCCHKEFRGVVHKVSNYCPKCGCRMVEPQERSE